MTGLTVAQSAAYFMDAVGDVFRSLVETAVELKDTFTSESWIDRQQSRVGVTLALGPQMVPLVEALLEQGGDTLRLEQWFENGGADNTAIVEWPGRVRQVSFLLVGVPIDMMEEDVERLLEQAALERQGSLRRPLDATGIPHTSTMEVTLLLRPDSPAPPRCLELEGLQGRATVIRLDRINSQRKAAAAAANLQAVADPAAAPPESILHQLAPGRAPPSYAAVARMQADEEALQKRLGAPANRPKAGARQVKGKRTRPGYTLLVPRPPAVRPQADVPQATAPPGAGARVAQATATRAQSAAVAAGLPTQESALPGAHLQGVLGAEEHELALLGRADLGAAATLQALADGQGRSGNEVAPAQHEHLGALPPGRQSLEDPGPRRKRPGRAGSRGASVPQSGDSSVLASATSSPSSRPEVRRRREAADGVATMEHVAKQLQVHEVEEVLRAQPVPLDWTPTEADSGGGTDAGAALGQNA